MEMFASYLLWKTVFICMTALNRALFTRNEQAVCAVVNCTIEILSDSLLDLLHLLCNGGFNSDVEQTCVRMGITASVNSGSDIGMHEATAALEGQFSAMLDHLLENSEKDQNEANREASSGSRPKKEDCTTVAFFVDYGANSVNLLKARRAN